METRSQQDEERANSLEVQVQEAKMIAEDADRKYEEVRKQKCKTKQLDIIAKCQLFFVVAAYSFMPKPTWVTNIDVY